jgi:hypothetical protein
MELLAGSQEIARQKGSCPWGSSLGLPAQQQLHITTIFKFNPPEEALGLFRWAEIEYSFAQKFPTQSGDHGFGKQHVM